MATSDFWGRVRKLAASVPQRAEQFVPGEIFARPLDAYMAAKHPQVGQEIAEGLRPENFVGTGEVGGEVMHFAKGPYYEGEPVYRALVHLGKKMTKGGLVDDPSSGYLEYGGGGGKRWMNFAANEVGKWVGELKKAGYAGSGPPPSTGTSLNGGSAAIFGKR